MLSRRTRQGRQVQRPRQTPACSAGSWPRPSTAECEPTWQVPTAFRGPGCEVSWVDVYTAVLMHAAADAAAEAGQVRQLIALQLLPFEDDLQRILVEAFFRFEARTDIGIILAE